MCGFLKGAAMRCFLMAWASNQHMLAACVSPATAPPRDALAGLCRFLQPNRTRLLAFCMASSCSLLGLVLNLRAPLLTERIPARSVVPNSAPWSGRVQMMLRYLQLITIFCSY